ncbi:hypothetical protein OG762_47375 (plasmid) [Streptomyces sp. NBC_01136]|uniref:hypothetical protein n=1 Tax=unclassified Streptomyces TaxID=2593676 RepID=UPI002F90BA86|nr:hypothetical protein OG762_47375 [Streptomyces sp. NBC_01136]
MKKTLSAAVKSVSLVLVSGAAILTVVVPAVAQVSTSSVSAAGATVVTPQDDRGGW